MSLILRLILYLTFSPFIPPQSHFDPGEHPEQAYKEEKGGETIIKNEPENQPLTYSSTEFNNPNG